jgi:N-methylhydantoinase A/oxoprolinase/acetone carboxylase beta subunit
LTWTKSGDKLGRHHIFEEIAVAAIPFDERDCLVVGIDTGGTYTDGVLLDYHGRTILASTKSLTTRHDLTQCVTAVLGQLPIDDPARVKLVSISTTLATNAIAEGRGRRVALVLVGYDPELVRAYDLAGRFGTPIYRYFCGGHDLQGAEQAPLEETEIAAWVSDLAQRHEIDAVAVSAYFSPLNNSHEECIAEALADVTDLPVVLGHQLSMDLDSIQRATTATLNASLLAILKDFMSAVSAAMIRRGIHAPLMVVKGDGTLVSAESVARRPVETVHSGPAASAIGARFLSGLDRALVIDIGGTTTDLAVIDGGQVMISDQGAMVGGYRTAVKGAALQSIGLGGDSHISLGHDDRLIIGPQRVVPLAYLAHTNPSVHRQLLALAHRAVKDLSADDLEYWRLAGEATELVRDRHPMVRSVIDILARGPQSLREILKQLGLFHPMQFHSAVRDLIRQEIVEQAGLTPTDLLHVSGQYCPWDKDAAQAAVGSLCRLSGRTPSTLNDAVLTTMAEMIVREVMVYLSHKALPERPRWPTDDFGWWVFENSLYPAHPYLRTRLQVDMPIVGIGAPAHIFLQRVADALNTELILPPHYGVANAVGAVSGSVVVSRQARIYPQFYELNVVGYYVQAGNGRMHFGGLEPALAYASEATRQAALAEATAGGADAPQVVLQTEPDGPDTYRVLARAIGTPSLGREDRPRDA